MDLSLLPLIALGFAVAVYGTIIGAGGGFILVPALLLIYPDHGPEQATAISLAVVWANATSGTAAYARQGRVDLVTGALFAVSSAPGVVGGALLVHLMPERLFSGLFGALLLAVAAVTLWPRPRTIREPRPTQGLLVRTMTLRDGVTYRYAYDPRHVVLLSLGVGFVSSLFGVGGGVVNVPAMHLLFRIPLDLAVATSQLIIACMAGGATVVHLINGTLDGGELLRVLFLALGAVPGAQVGARIAPRLRTQTVLLLLIIALIALAVRLITSAVFDV